VCECGYSGILKLKLNELCKFASVEKDVRLKRCAREALKPTTTPPIIFRYDPALPLAEAHELMATKSILDAMRVVLTFSTDTLFFVCLSHPSQHQEREVEFRGERMHVKRERRK
jgi:hypothetical protein